MPLLEYTQDCLDAAQGKWPASGEGYFDPPRQPGQPRRADRPKAIRVFKNGFIENVFAKSHPVMPIVWFLPIIVYGLYSGYVHRGASSMFGMFFGGWFLWTLLEYFLHRIVFHMGATNPEERFRAFMVHGYHHEFTNDKMRLVAPPIMSWPLAVIVS